MKLRDGNLATGVEVKHESAIGSHKCVVDLLDIVAPGIVRGRNAVTPLVVAAVLPMYRVFIDIRQEGAQSVGDGVQARRSG